MASLAGMTRTQLDSPLVASQSGTIARPPDCPHRAGKSLRLSDNVAQSSLGRRIVSARVYERSAHHLLRATAETAIAARPDVWRVIAGTGGARKACIALPGRGKRDGARVIDFHHVPGALIELFDVYAKTVQEDISHADKRDLKAAIGDIIAAADADRTGEATGESNP